jgi:ketosteroid isomerase-like protein
MRFLSLAALILLGACQAAAPPEMTDAERAQIEAEAEQAIADQWDGFIEAVLAVDYDGWASYWTSDARVLQPGMDLSGSALFDYVRDFFDGGVQFLTFDVGSFEVFVHGDAAYQIGQIDESAVLPGGEPAEWHDYFFVRWVKQENGEWGISYLLAGPRDAPPEG